MLLRVITILALFVAYSATGSALNLAVTRSVGSAYIVGVQPTRLADVVLLDAGYETGMRQGMVLKINRNGFNIAEIVIVDIRPQVSAALIVQLAKNQFINSGDYAVVKTLKV